MHAHIHSPANPRRLTQGATAALQRWDAPPRLDDRSLALGQLLAAFKGAARYIGLRGNVIVAMDYFFGLTRAQDWAGQGRPIVWPSAREQGEALGLSPSGVKFLNRRLIELGLIIAKDSPTGARWGRRNHNGQIIEAFGFDLSPMAHRFDEFAAVRDAGRADDAVRAQLRRRKTVAIKSIGQLVRTAAERKCDTPELYQLAEGTWTITEGFEPSADRRTLVRIVDELEALQARVFALYRTLVDQAQTSAVSEMRTSGMEELDSNPTEPVSELPNNNYKPTKYPMDSNSSETSSSEFENHRDSPAPGQEGRGGDVPVPTVKPKEVVALAPNIGLYLSEDLNRVDMPRAIMGVIRAAEIYAFKELSVSKSLWADAQKAMGLWPAALAVMVVSAKDPDYFSRTPAHYFAGMVAKAKNGTLRLDRSIWGLRSRNDADAGKA
jgi:replication initiation protein RepC